ncbi:glycosyltransferase [Sphingobium phenoxybenzoativorans]|uniref:Glycosyltransferase n=1 Tax=Sphingobium phenoxybenzoativorans TaxID=1592790 RepID=A0A975Q1R9_9SPHN|nr:glycosyltransferase [Sphingobium phenoxybenzoativorans]QUT05668.1 glycosyltransferase [Sphingobium phenoxybenzoativorans]
MSVSIIITCFNEGRYIPDTVRSVLDQTHASLIDKIVIADDGSDAETIQVLQDIQTWDPRIEIIYGRGGLGLPANRNLAAARCSSKYLAILDGDDIWTADKLGQQVAMLEQDEGIGLVYSNYYAFPDGNIAAARVAGVLDITKNSGGPEGSLARAYFLNDPPIIPSTIVVRRDRFEEIGGFDGQIRVFEDTDFFLRMAQVCKFGLVNAPLMYKRGRASSITGGRADLMAHHAFVALKYAAAEPAFYPLVPKRLAERARKLGNQKYLLGDRKGAVQHLRLATKLDIWNFRAWASWIGAAYFHGTIETLFGQRLAKRRMAIGSLKSSNTQKRASAVVLSVEYPPFPGGIATYCGQVVNELRKRQVDVSAVVARHDGFPMQADSAGTFRYFKHNHIGLVSALKAFKILAQKQDAIVLAADSRTTILVGIWAFFSRRPYRVMLHGSEVLKFASGSLLGHLMAPFYRRAELVLANSRATLDLFEKRFGKSERNRVSYLGVNEDSRRPPSAEFHHPDLQRLANDERIVCTVGRVESRKGQLEAIAVIAAAQRDHGMEPVTYVIGGLFDDEGYPEALQNAADEAGVVIILTGRLSEDDVRLLYHRSMVHILCAQPIATKIEGFGLVLLEAAAQYCPTITTNVGGIPEVIGPDNDLVFAPDDIPTMAQTLASLCANRNLREKAAAEAYQRLALFSWSSCVDKTFPEFAVPEDLQLSRLASPESEMAA